MQCLFEAIRPVHLEGRLVEGVFRAELTEVLEAFVSNGLIEPVFAPEEPRDVPVWEVDHLEA
jgi:hypothetical protein